MPIRLKDAPQTFLRRMDEVFKECIKFISAYIDDILIAFSNITHHDMYLKIFTLNYLENRLG